MVGRSIDITPDYSTMAPMPYTQRMLPGLEGAVNRSGSTPPPAPPARRVVPRQQMELPFTTGARARNVYKSRSLRPAVQGIGSRIRGAYSSSAVMGRMAKGARFAAGSLWFDAVFAPIDMGIQGISQSVKWAAKTGREEDYLGGFVYGATRAAGANIGTAGGAMIGATIGSALLPIGGTLVGGLIGGIGGYIAGESVIGDFAMDRGQMFSAAAVSASAKRKVQFGSNFRDTQQAYTMRQVAVQEMAGSLLNARQYLANEASFFHR